MTSFNDCVDTGGFYVVNGENGKVNCYIPTQYMEEAKGHMADLDASGVFHFAIKEEISPFDHKSTFIAIDTGFVAKTLEDAIQSTMILIGQSEGI